jgi:hypothetical protein
MAARRAKRQPASEAVKTLQPEAAVIIYHQRTGTIAHAHFFSAAGGGKLPGKEELERVAYATAENDGCDMRMHAAMHVDPTALKPGTGYRVSIKDRASVLVAVKAGRNRPQSLLRDV